MYIYYVHLSNQRRIVAHLSITIKVFYICSSEEYRLSKYYVVLLTTSMLITRHFTVLLRNSGHYSLN
jgi:hypothetical protein